MCCMHGLVHISYYYDGLMMYTNKSKIFMQTHVQSSYNSLAMGMLKLHIDLCCVHCMVVYSRRAQAGPSGDIHEVMVR